MNKSLKEKLIAVPPEKLVELIVELSADDDVSWSKVERLVSNPTDNSKRFLRRLEDIKTRGGFIPWKYSSDFSDELEDLLADLDSGVASPEEGFKLIFDFYKADASFFEQADDSSGHIGDVFRGTAIDLFVKFASQISDKKLIINHLLELLKDDGYGVRDDLIGHASQFLSESELRHLFELVEGGASEKNGRYDSWKLQSLAKQLKDAPLYEKLARRGDREPNSRILVDIAEVYFLANDFIKAQEVLDSINPEDTFGRHEQEDLQKKLYLRLGKTVELYKIVYDAFQRYFSELTLRELIAVAGENRRTEFITEATEKIRARPKWNSQDADFLKYIGDANSLEELVLKHRAEIQSGIFYSAANTAEFLVDSSKYKAAVILYRGLIAETLKKSIAKYYHHAVNYLEILAQISPKIEFWDGIDDHTMYLQKLKKMHALKKSLWSQYKI